MESKRLIKRLDENVVNKIAAGEVIQRPANALKELLENCIDAKSTCIQIIVKDGGMKKLVIQDNGTGIRKDDLDIVCERFTTSKLETYDDLSSIQTYGFRGEALASVSHVSHVTITTKTSNSICAYKACYVDGKLKDTPKPCSGNDGTQILVEDLFYNLPTRRKALKSNSAEHIKIVEVVSKYAIHNATIGFSLKKHGETNFDVHTKTNSNQVDNIRAIYGPSVAKELIDFNCEDTNLSFTSKGLISNANFNAKKLVFLLFINHRLVSSQSLLKAIESVYAAYLPCNTHPFVYLSIDILPKNVDVNVHPTKHEVHFLNEDAIVDKITRDLDKCLLNSNSSRKMFNQTLLSFNDSSFISTKDPQPLNSKISDQHLVRTDYKEQKLDAFIDNENETLTTKTDQVILESETDLTSIKNLRQKIMDDSHPELTKVIRELVVVGCINSKQMIVQSGVKMYLINTHQASAELFYQLVMRQFGNMGFLELSVQVSLKELILIALEKERNGWTDQDFSKEQIAVEIVRVLTQNAEMLKTYFSLEISENGNLCSLPLILDQYTIPYENLDSFILRLGTDVEWDDEEACFKSFARILASCYALPPDISEDCLPNLSDEPDAPANPPWAWTVKHVLCPAFKKVLLPPKEFATDGTILLLTSLPELYKVFERC